MKELKLDELFLIVAKNSASSVVASETVYNSREDAEDASDSDIENVMSLKEILEEHGAI